MTRELIQVQEGKENGCINSISLSEIEFPVPASFGHVKGGGQMIEEIMAGDILGAEGENVGRGLLTVHEAKSPRLKLAHKGNQRNL